MTDNRKKKNPISEYLSEIGRKGGKASAGKPRNIDPEVAKERGRKGAEKRWGKKDS